MISVGNWSPFKVDHSKNSTCSTTKMESKGVVGLKILTVRNTKPIFIFQRNQIQPLSSSSCNCYLKSCFLCHKNLSSDKDIYMYRGDQGFCSEECRSRQIYIDEIRELEVRTKKMVQEYRQSHGGGRCESHRRHRHKPMTPGSPVIFS